MEIFSNDAGVEITVDELQKIIELGLLPDLIHAILELQGDLFVQALEEDIPEELLEEVRNTISNSHIEFANQLSDEDKKVIGMLKLLGYHL